MNELLKARTTGSEHELVEFGGATMKRRSAASLLDSEEWFVLLLSVSVEKIYPLFFTIPG